jgi:regulator of replication initiation timing
MKQLSGNSELFSSLSQQALNEKVASFLAENNTIEFKAPKAKKAAAPKKKATKKVAKKAASKRSAKKATKKTAKKTK